MKKHLSVVLLLCILLGGCAPSQPKGEPSVEPVQMETAVNTEESVEAAVVILPLPDNTMDELDNAIVNVSFSQGDFYRNESGDIFLRMQVYTYDKYDLVDISGLKAGDTILLSDEETLVSSVERNEYGTVMVNGGLDEGGVDLVTDDSGVYYALGYNDVKSWNLAGEAEYIVSESFVFSDSADLEQGLVTYTAEDLVNAGSELCNGFQPQNTMVRIEDGQVVAMERIYTP